MSVVCEAFGCVPDVAERQSRQLVTAIIDYRNARYAIELMNGGADGAQKLGQHRELMDLLLEMKRAQLGPSIRDVRDALDAIRANAPPTPGWGED